MAVVPTFEVMFLIRTGNQHLVHEVMPYFLALVRDPNIYGKVEIMESNKGSSSENALNGQG
jgi:hypothetical protein